MTGLNPGKYLSLGHILQFFQLVQSLALADITHRSGQQLVPDFCKAQLYIHLGGISESRLRILTEHMMWLTASFLPHGWTEGFSFHCLLSCLTLLSRYIQMKKPNCYYNFIDLRHLYVNSRHLALFETYRIQGCSFSFSKYVCDSQETITYPDSTKTPLPNQVKQEKHILHRINYVRYMWNVLGKKNN